MDDVNISIILLIQNKYHCAVVLVTAGGLPLYLGKENQENIQRLEDVSWWNGQGYLFLAEVNKK